MDLAAFANTALIRYLDCNDAYAARGTGHPSDMIPGVLAVAGAHKANGQAVITISLMACGVFGLMFPNGRRAGPNERGGAWRRQCGRRPD